MNKNLNKSFAEKWIFQNGSYKLVALFVALVLWVAILGRKDFVMTMDLPMNFHLPEQTEIVNDVVRTVKVKVGGPRLALKRFQKANKKLQISLRRAGIGRMTFRVQENDFVIPPKVRLIAVSPSFLSIEIREKNLEN